MKHTLTNPRCRHERSSRLIGANGFSRMLLLSGVLCAASVLVVFAQAPAQLSIQGYLEDGGNPINTPQTIELSIHTAVSGGTQLFVETHASVQVTDGVYTLLLGSIGDLTGVDFNQDLWLQTKVGATTLSPRTRLLGSPSAMTLVVPAGISGAAPDGRVLTVTNTATTGAYGHGLTAFSAGHGASAGLYGVSSSLNGSGVVGLATGTIDGAGVYGESSAGSGFGVGVHGVSGSSSGIGVRGEATETTGQTVGVLGESHAPSGYGVHGSNVAADGIGVYGSSGSGAGMKGVGDTGVHGLGFVGVYGETGDETGTAVLGVATSTAGGLSTGVAGSTSSMFGIGVYAISANALGRNFGLVAENQSSEGYAGFLYSSGVGAYIAGGPGSIADLILAGTDPFGDDNGNLYSDPDYPSSDLVFAANDAIALHLDENNDEANSRFTVSNGTNATVFAVYESGTVEVNGTMVHSSDRNRKEDVRDADVHAVLNGVVGLPMQTWRYRDDPATHIGPMAQDFHATFGLGRDEKGIATVDADGVALASIQALYELVEAQRLMVEAQRAVVERQGAEIRLLKEQVAKLASRIQSTVE